MSKKIMKALSVSLLTSLVGLTFIPSILNAETCKEKTFSGLPHSFGGVDRCNRDSEWQKEAQGRCREKAGELYTKGYRIEEMFSPDYAGDVSSGEECTRHVGGICVDKKRVCTATFSRLNCRIRVCRLDDF